MRYLAQRLDTGEEVEFEDDPDLVVGHGETLDLALGGGIVTCIRVFAPYQVMATDRRKCLDDNHLATRSDGRLTSMQLPTKEQCLASGLPLAPDYNSNGEASFMTRHRLSEYVKKLNDKDEHGQHALNL